MLKRLYLWFISLFERDLSTITEEEVTESNPLKLNLQFFAEDLEDDPEDDPKDDPEDDDPEDDELDLDELLKDKDFKKQYNKRFKKQLGKRMKKYEGIDPDEYRRLKEQAGKKKDPEDDPDDELETLRNKLSDKEKRVERAERREKRAMVKEYAVDNQVNPKLLSRLINVDEIDLDEDGEAENLDDLFDELEEEFPEYFGAADEDDDEDEEDVSRKKKRKSSYVPGSRKKGNKKNKVDPMEAGRQKALERHKKEDK